MHSSQGGYGVYTSLILPGSGIRIYACAWCWGKYKHNRSGPGNWDYTTIAHSKVTAEEGAWRYQRVLILRADGCVDRCMFGVCADWLLAVFVLVVCLYRYIYCSKSPQQNYSRGIHMEKVSYFCTRRGRARETITFIPHPSQEDQQPN